MYTGAVGLDEANRHKTKALCTNGIKKTNGRSLVESHASICSSLKGCMSSPLSYNDAKPVKKVKLYWATVEKPTMKPTLTFSLDFPPPRKHSTKESYSCEEGWRSRWWRGRGEVTYCPRASQLVWNQQWLLHESREEAVLQDRLIIKLGLCSLRPNLTTCPNNIPPAGRQTSQLHTFQQLGGQRLLLCTRPTKKKKPVLVDEASIATFI